MNEKILKTLQALKENSKKRNFSQTYDLIINLKEFDVKKLENRIDDSFSLPKGRGKEARVVIFSDNVKTENADVLGTNEVNGLVKNKRAAKKFANEADFLFGEPKLMPVVGKSLGTLLGPRGKIPKVLVGNVEDVIKKHKNSTKIRVKDSPVIQCIVGNESMKDEDVVENIEALLKFIEGRLPGGRSNIGKIMMKTTMGKPMKLEVA